MRNRITACVCACSHVVFTLVTSIRFIVPSSWCRHVSWHDRCIMMYNR
jgi:hypothetical protein